MSRSRARSWCCCHAVLRSTWPIAVLLAVAGLVATSTAFAQPSETERSIAAELFRDAKKLMDEGRFAEACPKLAESQKLDPGGGTLLNLGVCHEAEGKLATAWTVFKEALASARRDGREDRIAFALERIEALEPRLARLTVTVRSDANVPDLEVRLDGVVIPKLAWGSSLPVDPGPHKLSATAPRRRPWEVSVDVSGERVRKNLVVPALIIDAEAVPTAKPVRPPPAATPAKPAPKPRTDAATAAEAGSATTTVGWILAGVGVAGIGVGSYFGLSAISKRKESDDLCKGGCTEEGVSRFDEAKKHARIADIAVAAGLVATGVGGYLILSASGASAPARRGRARAPHLAVVAGPYLTYGSFGAAW